MRMNKSIVKAVIGFLAVFMLMSMSAVSAFAYSEEAEAPEFDVDWDILVNQDTDGEGILTPEGNLTLVDDIDESHSEALQYMTVQTKGGNYFYIVVDRSGDEDNVYFLNMVDEADIMALMDKETQDKFNEAMMPSGKSEEIKDDSTILFSNQDVNKEADIKENKPGKDKSSSPAAILIVFLVIGAAVAGGYYFFKIKPGKNQPDEDDDLEFYDDEDYVSEDSVIEGTDHETLVSENQEETGDGTVQADNSIESERNE